MKLTDWFPADMPPVHGGLYKTRPPGCIETTWSVWKDGFWHYATGDARVSVQMAEADFRSHWQVREWRGITKEPK
jgi:hypothetical protein